MFIEVYLKGQLANRCFVDATISNPVKDELLSFKERFEEREKTIKLLIEDFIQNKLPKQFKGSPDLQLAIVLESKMNEDETHPKPEVNIKKPIKDIPRQKLVEKEVVPFVRPKGVYSNPQLPEEFVQKSSSEKIRIGIHPVRVNKGRSNTRAFITNEF